jgi:hypothetical protein
MNFEYHFPGAVKWETFITRTEVGRALHYCEVPLTKTGRKSPLKQRAIRICLYLNLETRKQVEDYPLHEFLLQPDAGPATLRFLYQMLNLPVPLFLLDRKSRIPPDMERKVRAFMKETGYGWIQLRSLVGHVLARLDPDRDPEEEDKN